MSRKYTSIAAFLAAGIFICTTATAQIEPLSYDASCDKASMALSDISAKSAILIEAGTGNILYAKNEKEHRAIASTTKIMTALLTLEAGELDREFTVNPVAIRVEGTSMGLTEGDIVTRRALCYGMLLPSGNDAANAAAVDIAGSKEAFAKLMNKKAQSLGMQNSSFVTPSGLDADNQYSCAYDLAVLTAYALKNPDFKEICSKKSAVVSFGNPPYERTLYNSNKLLKSYDGCIGVKTGFTDNARRTLVSAAERDGVTLIAVTLNAPNDWQDHTRMLNYGFECVSLRSLRYNCSELSVPVIGSDKETVGVALKENITAALTDSQVERLKTEIYLPEFVYADIRKGDKLGQLRFISDGRIMYTVDLIAKSDCLRARQSTDFFTTIISFIRRLLPF